MAWGCVWTIFTENILEIVNEDADKVLFFHLYYFGLCLFSGYLSLGYSTPFLSLGSSYMYSSLAAAKAAVISVGEEIATQGLPAGICPLVFVFTGSGNGNFNHKIFSCFTTLLQSTSEIFHYSIGTIQNLFSGLIMIHSLS